MTPIKPLPPEDLRRVCDLGGLEFETTEDLELFEGILGQPRALAAVEFGIGIEAPGFNLFAFGPAGTGKHSAVRQYLERKAPTAGTPPDLCYVNNFQDGQRPRALHLPAGRGSELRRAMDHLVEELATALQTALESEQFQTRKQALEAQFEERQGKALAELGDEAGDRGLALLRTPIGIVFAPLRGEEVLSPEEFQKLPERERSRLEEEIEKFKEKLQKVMRKFPRWQREAREKLRRLNREVSQFAIGPLIEEIREQFSGLEPVQAYLAEVESDVLENAQRLTGPSENPMQTLLEAAGGGLGGERPWVRRYRVNLLVDQGESRGAPVVYEDNPTYSNLVGRVEHIPQMGAAVTDFNLVRAGALHRANGGYLLIDALKLLRNPYAYEGLKRTLQAGSIKIESLGEALSLISTYSLEPEPIDLDLKVVLIGEPLLYYMISRLDPDFEELFKVAADFGSEIEWNAETQADYARLIARLAREESLRPLERDAVERLIEHSARTAEDSERISLLMRRVLDLLREADFWAGQRQAARVSGADVERAIDARIFRSDRLREQLQTEVLRETLLIDTAGSRVGQVNGLSVLQLGDFSFGRPTRITARVRLGKGEVVDIEREVELGGPLHSKGVLILAGFLGGRYAAERPLSLSASLVFEQSYGGVDGDSASAAELCSLLSAVAETPLRQSLAITGSVNQHGAVQAIGGVNQKIEGFFDLCRARGLDGEQGVIIPAANVKHLMLRREVIDAVAEGRFQIWPVETVDQVLELLTGLEAGERRADGSYPEGTLNHRVERRLESMAARAREFGAPPASGPPGDPPGSPGPGEGGAA